MPSGCRVPSRRVKTRDEVAIVCGALLEREPERSIYNRICAIEWNGPVGEVATCGGNFVIRAESFRKVGGFNPIVIAAEDDDLCLRVRANGGKILRLDAPMAWHDAAMTRIGQWWKRAVRSGYAFAQVSSIHGRGPYRHFVRESRSAWFWGVGVPVGDRGAGGCDARLGPDFVPRPLLRGRVSDHAKQSLARLVAVDGMDLRGPLSGL